MPGIRRVAWVGLLVLLAALGVSCDLGSAPPPLTLTAPALVGATVPPARTPPLATTPPPVASPPSTAPAATGTPSAQAPPLTLSPAPSPADAGLGLPPAPTYAPAAAWPTDRSPTPFPPRRTIPDAAALALPPAPALAVFAAALRPQAAADLAGQEGRPVYQLALHLDLAGRQLLGRERITYTNRQDTPITRLVLRLYPNFPGVMDERNSPTGFPRLQVGAVRAGDASAEAAYLAGNTAIAIPLPAPLAPGARQAVELEFRLSTANLGPTPDIVYLKSFYPLLAVYEAGGWRLDVTAFPDQVYAESAFYTVDFTAPADQVLASSGTETGVTPAAALATHHILAGPVREFAATASPRYTQQTKQMAGITVRATSLLTDTAQASRDLDIAASALETYNTLIGPYPFNDFDLLIMLSGGGGIEFPGYVMISHLRDLAHLEEHVVAHEVAHQWWYSLVGDDIFRESWLDESFAEYTTYLYLRQHDGPRVADQVFAQQIAGVWPGYTGEVATASPAAGPRVGRAIWEFRDFGEYDGIIYGKGPVFLARLHALLGDDRFTRLLQTHFARNKYNIATGRAFLRAALDVAGPDAPAVTDLYRAWIEGE